MAMRKIALFTGSHLKVWLADCLEISDGQGPGDLKQNMQMVKLVILFKLNFQKLINYFSESLYNLIRAKVETTMC
jgi:hypothetical protein